MKNKDHIVIIGAGAAGLMAAKELSAAGYAVTILEAQDKAGGRMCTSIQNKFGFPAEPGAEFIHGNLPLTLGLLREGNIGYSAINSKMMHFTNDKIKRHDDFDKHWDELMQHIDQLEQDTTIDDFLSKYFAGEKYEELHRSVRGFAEGYDLADTSKAAIKPLQKEWLHEEETQYRIDGGYIQLTHYLLQICLKNKVNIHYNCFVENIEWKKAEVMITTSGKQKFSASKVIITVSAGILQAGKINFIPAIPSYTNAIANLGFGSVIKILLQFKEPFWKEQTKDAGFILSNETIPTWWTQQQDNNLLTGWLGGPNAEHYKNKSSREIIEIAIESLSKIFNRQPHQLHEYLLHAEAFNWSNNYFSLGGYSYNTLHSENAKRILNTPTHSTIYFAGEALYSGDAPATVEAALQSGLTVSSFVNNEK